MDKGDFLKFKIDTKFAGAIILVIILMIIGTISFHFIEKWSYVDSFYFTGVTLTTIGYGDLVPVTDSGKVFTILFSLMGIGVFLYALSVIAENYFVKKEASAFHRFESSVSRKISKIEDDVETLNNPKSGNSK